MPAKPLTPEELEDARRLKALFKTWQERQKEAMRDSSQESAAEALGFNQSSLSQYLNGKIPLNIEAGVKFARLLDCKIGDFSKAITASILEAAMLAGGATSTGGGADASALTKEELRVLAIFRQASQSNPTAKAVIDDALTLAQGLLDEAFFQQKQG